MEKEDLFAAEKKNRELKGGHIMEKERQARTVDGRKLKAL